MVGSGTAAFEQAYAPACVGGGRGDCGFKLRPANVVGTGAGDEQTAGAQHLEGAQVQLLVAAQGTFYGSLCFGERRRIKHDGTKSLACI